MLKSLRESVKSTPMRVFLSVLVVGFALWGIDDVFRSVGSSDNAVEVSSVKTPAIEAAREFARIRRAVLPNASDHEAIGSGLLSRVLSDIAQRSLHLAEAERMNLTSTRNMVTKTIAKEPAFAGQSGQFNLIQFQDALARIGLSEEEYVNLLTKELLHNQVMEPIQAGLRYPLATAEILARWRSERRTIRYASIPVDKDAPPLPSDSEIASWYAENASRFASPDLRFGVVAVLSPDDFADEITPDETTLAEAYEARRSDFEAPEFRQIQQMVFTEESRAHEALSRLKSGEDFATVAQDMLALTENDTDLGMLTQDHLVDAVGEAVFALKTIGLTEVVETSLGYHLLRVNEIEEARIVPLEEMRKWLTEELQREGAIDLVYERIGVLEDALGRGETIEEAARESKASLINFNGIDRNGFDIDGALTSEGILASVEVREAMWQAEIGEVGLVEELGNDTFFILRVDNEAAARERPLGEVRERAITAMRLEKAIDLARQKAEKIATAFDPLSAAAEARVTFSEDITLRRDGVGLDHESARLIATQAFEQEIGATNIVETGSEAILVTTKSTEIPRPQTVKEEAKIFQQNLHQSLVTSIELAVARALEERFEVRINPLLVQQLLIGQ